MQKSYVGLQIIYIDMEGGGGVNLREEKILSKLFPDINLLTQIDHPPKRSTGVSLNNPSGL